MSIRIADEGDWARLIEIYNEAVETGYATADTVRATVESKRDWLGSHSPDRYPIYVEETDASITGWCSLSPYRPGRHALRHTAEISYYVASEFWRKGVASRLIGHAIADAARLELRTLFGILLESNHGSVALLKKLGFEQWGFLPKVADFDGAEVGHVYWGKRLASEKAAMP